MNRRSLANTIAGFSAAMLTAFTAALAPAWAQGADKKPNILVIMGDDVGWFNVERLPSGHHVR